MFTFYSFLPYQNVCTECDDKVVKTYLNILQLIPNDHLVVIHELSFHVFSRDLLLLMVNHISYTNY